MAERRMFAKTIVTSDAFLDMPATTRCLYFMFAMLADDDGFVNSPRSIMRQSGATEDDLRLLLAKRYVLGFDSGVIVIKHWKIHNIIKTDRYKETTYLEEKSMLKLDDKKAYTEVGSNSDPVCIQFGSKVDTQVSIGKDSIGKDRLITYKGATLDDVKAYASERGRPDLAKPFFDYYSVADWKDKDGKPIINWKQKFIAWESRNPKAEQKQAAYGDADSFFEAAIRKTYDEDDEEIL